MKPAVLAVMLLVLQAFATRGMSLVPAGQSHARAVIAPATGIFGGQAVGSDGMGNFVEGDLDQTPTPFTLDITRYVSMQEAERYAQILRASGQTGLLQALRNENLGYFRLSGQPPRVVIFAQLSQDATSYTVTALCQRWLDNFVEGFDDRRAQYPFAYATLSFDRSGKSQGTLFTAAHIKFGQLGGNGSPLVGVEDYANIPDRLKDVRFNGPLGSVQ